MAKYLIPSVAISSLYYSSRNRINSIDSAVLVLLPSNLFSIYSVMRISLSLIFQYSIMYR
uniref:CPXV012 protein n=1 Tax=Heterorhabditis bacteriophora TaxID=37862 RepID=A0A1I7WG64_HETBA